MSSRAFRVNTRREIKKSLGRYLAILFIIALGVGFFSGLQICHQAMLETCEAYVSDTNMYDFMLVSTLGMTEDDEIALEKMDGIRAAEGSRSKDAYCFIGDGEDMVIKLHSLTPSIGLPLLISGRMPLSDRECVVDARIIHEDGIGSELKLSASNDDDTKDMLKHDAYKIVGLVRSVNYMNLERGTSKLGNGTVSGFAYIPTSGFDCDYFTEIYLDAELPGTVYSVEYKNAVDAMEDSVKAALESRGEIRFESIVKEANDELNEHRKEYDDGVKEYEDKKKDVEQELSDAQDKIDKGAAELYGGASKLIELAPQEAELKYNLVQIDDGIAAVNATLADLYAKRAYVQAALDELQALRDQLPDIPPQPDEDTDEDTDEEPLPSTEPESEETLPTVEPDATADDEAPVEAPKATEEDAQAEMNELAPPAVEEQTEQNSIILPDEQSGEAPQLELLAARRTESIAYFVPVSSQAMPPIDPSVIDAQEQELLNQLAQIDAGIAQANAKLDQLRGQRNEVYAALMDITIGHEEIEVNSKKIWDAVQELEDGRAEADEKLREAEDELEDAKQKILDAEQEIADIEPPDTYLMTRSENVGYACFENDSSIVAGIAKVFPLFFFMVAALVCVTTMTRMISEQRTQIGTLKALGYSDFTIMWKFISYSGSAAIIGSVLGYFGGTKLFPFVIWMAYGIMYGFADLVYAVNIPLALISLAVALLCSVGTTLLVCRRELRSMPAELMRPKAPKAGKRILLEHIGFVWKRLGFLQKVSLRNIFRYRGRLVMMLLGVGGCTALVLTGLGIRDSISDIAKYQFDEISKYDYSIVFSDVMSDDDIDAFIEENKAYIEHPCFVCQRTSNTYTPAGKKKLTVIACDNPDITKLIDLHDHSGNGIPYPAAGELVLTNRIASQLEAEPGDMVTIALDDAGLETVTLKLSGICTNYVENYAYMNLASYASSGSVPEFKHAYAEAADKDRLYETSARLMDSDEVLNVSVTQDMRDRIGRMMNSMNYVVALVIASAAALAFIVLINLSNINIIERQREIATIKVLGFYSNETASYVFRENLMLTVFGALMGLPLGVLLHDFVMSQIKVDVVSFETIIQRQSYILAFIITVLFTVIVDLLLRKKLDKIHMAESLKSVE